MVVLFFLQTLWGTLVITIAIPASLAAGFGIIYSLGFSMNILSLLAFILVIGIVVDDAIVILESTYRHMEEGANSMPAARVGTTEVAFAAIANTLSLCAVFIPVAFTQGIIGRIFFEFGITAAVTVFASTVTALTLAPMLNSRLLVVSEKKNWLSSAINSALKNLEKIYGKILDWSLNNRFLVIIIALVALLLGVFFFLQLSTEFAPDVDSSEFMISFETPQGATLSETDNYAARVEEILEETPEVKRWFLAVGLGRGAGPGAVNSGMSFVRLVDPARRPDHQLEVMQKIREKLAQVPGGRSYVLVAGGPGGGAEAPIQVVLKYSDLYQLSKYSEKLMEWMREQDDFVGINTDLEMENPQIDINFRRDKMARSGVSVREISRAINFMMGTPEISEIERKNERYKIITEVSPKPLDPDALEEIHIRDNNGELISLANFVEFEETVGPSEIGHFDRRRAAIISASTPPGVVLGDALEKLGERIEATKPSGFEWTTAGQAQTMQESFQNLTVSLIFGIVFVYLVMAAQFESWLHPLTILMSLPLAGLGAFGLLYALDMTFSIFPFIGIIMLVGLVTKNGILLVDYTNVLIARGSEVKEAVARAGRVRFRSVLMTAISTILGMMPIAFGYGLGGEARAPMGWAVAGGMFSSSALTLLVIPVVYTLFDDLGEKLKTRSRHWCVYVFAFVSLVLAAGLFWQSVALFQGGLAGGVVATVAVVLLIVAFGLFGLSSAVRRLMKILFYPLLPVSLLFAVIAHLYPDFMPAAVDWLVTAGVVFAYSLAAVFVTIIWPEKNSRS
jgi:multidrug efflux pump subunit AcrB